jgi:hypothetical protein
MSNETSSVSLRFTDNVPTSGWQELVNSKQISVKQDTSFVSFGGPTLTDVSINLQPFEIAIVQAP